MVRWNIVSGTHLHCIELLPSTPFPSPTSFDREIFTWKHVAILLIGHMNPPIPLLNDTLKHRDVLFLFNSLHTLPIILDFLSLNFQLSTRSHHHNYDAWFLQARNWFEFPFHRLCLHVHYCYGREPMFPKDGKVNKRELWSLFKDRFVCAFKPVFARCTDSRLCVSLLWTSLAGNVCRMARLCRCFFQRSRYCGVYYFCLGWAVTMEDDSLWLFKAVSSVSRAPRMELNCDFYCDLYFQDLLIARPLMNSREIWNGSIIVMLYDSTNDAWWWLIFYGQLVGMPICGCSTNSILFVCMFNKILFKESYCARCNFARRY